VALSPSLVSPIESGYSFTTIHQTEIDHISKRQPTEQVRWSDPGLDERRLQPAPLLDDLGLPNFPKRAICQHEVALAISGGGVRSATFGLGVLQGLAKSSQLLLDRIGYTSSVSGGSYINSWFCSLIARGGFAEARDMLREQPGQLSTAIYSKEKTRSQLLLPISHLRQFSSYLTPARGLFSSDTWNIVGAYLLRLVPNATFVSLAATAIILLPYMALDLTSLELKQSPYSMLGLINLTVAMTVYGLFFGRLDLDDAKASKGLASHTAASFAGASILITPFLTTLSFEPVWKHHERWIISGQAAFITLILILAQIAFVLKTWSNCSTRLAQLKCFPLGTAIGLSSWLLLLRGSRLSLDHRLDPNSDLLPLRFQIAFMPLAITIVYLLIGSVYLFLIRYEDESQEWLNLVWGATMKWCCLWAAVSFVVLIAPVLWRPVRPWQGLLAIAIWLSLSSASVHAAFSGRTGRFGGKIADPLPDRLTNKRQANSKRLASMFAAIGPSIVICGGLILLALVGRTIRQYLFSNTSFMVSWLKPTGKSDQTAITELAAFMAISGASLWIAHAMDVNRLSMHNIYRFRLAKCYLAAADLISVNGGDDQGWFNSHSALFIPLAKVGLQGPYPLISAALNVTKHGSLDFQKRKALNFVFSPLFCGFHHESNQAADSRSDDKAVELVSFAYRSTKEYLSARQKLLRLGRSNTDLDGKEILLSEAMAVSGAAQSPNQGSHTSPAVAVLLTMMNIRLGAWVGNPRSKEGWRTYPSVGAGKLLINELGGNADDEQKEVYLSDGGHFENLGLYELIRRKCRIIIISDADCDPKYEFDDLLNAMERCYVDFGAKIDVDTSALKPDLQSHLSQLPYAVGRVTYANDLEYGAIVLFKPVMTVDAWDVTKRFDARNPHFPHEPTTNQWFDEEQFEAYRSIGESAIQRFSRDLRAGGCPPPCDVQAWEFLRAQLPDV